MQKSWDEARIGFRTLQEDDLARMSTWLRQEHVRAWWGDEYSDPAHVDAEFRPLLNGQTPTLGMIVELDGAPVGYIQRYFTSDWPEYWANQGFPDDTAGIDVTIGEASLLHKGLGTALIRTFLKRIVFADPRTARCIIDPAPDNAAAIRAYAKVGFTYLRTIHPPEHCEIAYLMSLERADFDG